MSSPTSAPEASIRAVVFDLDGLMFDTERLFYRIAGDLLAERGKTFTPSMMQAMIGRRANEGLERFRTMAGLTETVDQIKLEFKTRFVQLEATMVRTNPGLLELIRHLESHSIPRCVATSSGREYAERLLTQHGLLEHFTFLLTAEDVSRGKPDPEIYQTATKRHGYQSHQTLVLEDSPAGVAAGKAAGCFVVAVPHEHSPLEGLRAADLIAERLDEPRLLELIAQD